MIVVANAGPLISLARIGYLQILPELFGEIHVPQAVLDELVKSGIDRPGSSQIRNAHWVVSSHVQSVTAIDILRGQLDLGESEAIVLAIEIRADLILIDEARGRRIAESRGLARTGTLGILLQAKAAGLISEVGSVVDRLRHEGFWMSEDLYKKFIQLAGE